MRGEQGPKGAQNLGVGVEPKVRPLLNVKSPFGPCKPRVLLLADDNKGCLHGPKGLLTLGRGLTFGYIVYKRGKHL